MNRDPIPSDIAACQRGNNMIAMTVSELRRLAARHADSEVFASKVTVIAARQMIAAKRRVFGSA